MRHNDKWLKSRDVETELRHSCMWVRHRDTGVMDRETGGEAQRRGL